LSAKDVVYLVPFLPLLANGIMAVLFPTSSRALIPPEQQARETHRTVILALGGLSFAGFVGVASLAEAGTPYVLPAAALLAVSFALYFAALTVQSYKSRRNLDLVSDGLMEGGGLALALGLGALALRMASGGWQGYAIGSLLVAVSAIDTLVRLRLTWKDLRSREHTTKGASDA